MTYDQVGDFTSCGQYIGGQVFHYGYKESISYDLAPEIHQTSRSYMANIRMANTCMHLYYYINMYRIISRDSIE